MIDEKELPEFLSTNIPVLADRLRGLETPHAFHQLQLLVEYTMQCLRQNDRTGVKTSLRVASRLYSAGSKMVKSAVANVFIFSFSNMMNDKERRRHLEQLMPGSLLAEYKRQMLACNI